MSNVHYLVIEKPQDERAQKRDDLIFCIDYLENEARKADLPEVAYLLGLAQLSAREVVQRDEESQFDADKASQSDPEQFAG